MFHRELEQLHHSFDVSLHESSIYGRKEAYVQLVGLCGLKRLR